MNAVPWLLAGCLATAIFAASFAADDTRIETADVATVCAPNYAKHRRAEATYAGLDLRHGFQRDHEVPLCLAGADNRANVHYQPLAEAHAKDRLEWLACSEVCRGHLGLASAQAWFLGGDWRAAYRERFGEEP